VSSAGRWEDGDCPVICLDHERLVPLDPESLHDRETLRSFAQPLYDSCRECCDDMFSVV
jgi:hypothetical protein